MEEATQRSFIVGSEWIYYKFYTGPKTADVILTDLIKPIAHDLIRQSVIDKWFFIRYADPKHHLRVRFHVSDKGGHNSVITYLYKYLCSFTDEDLVWKVQLDTYQRELERYGKNTMELSETIFYYNSEAIVNFLDLIEGNDGEQLRWLFGLRATNSLLSAFAYSMDEKLAIMEMLKKAYGNEFNMSRPLKKQLDEKYREERARIELFMDLTLENETEYGPILEILQTSYQRLKLIAKEILEKENKNKLFVSKNSLMSSYIHMLMNRLFTSKNRINEMVCYDFLYRYYRSSMSRRKYQKGYA